MRCGKPIAYTREAPTGTFLLLYSRLSLNGSSNLFFPLAACPLSSNDPVGGFLFSLVSDFLQTKHDNKPVF